MADTRNVRGSGTEAARRFTPPGSLTAFLVAVYGISVWEVLSLPAWYRNMLADAAVRAEERHEEATDATIP